MPPGGRSDHARRVTVFAMLFVFWVVFSGHFDVLHLGLGLVCCGLVAWMSADLLLPHPPSAAMLVTFGRFLAYLPWLLYEVVLSNFHVVSLVLRPAEIRPRIVRFRTGLTSDVARVTLGNSITLTPGTITMDIEDDEFIVHAVSHKAAESVTTGDMERRVAHVFLERAPGADAEGQRG